MKHRFGRSVANVGGRQPQQRTQGRCSRHLTPFDPRSFGGGLVSVDRAPAGCGSSSTHLSGPCGRLQCDHGACGPRASEILAPENRRRVEHEVALWTWEDRGGQRTGVTPRSMPCPRRRSQAGDSRAPWCSSRRARIESPFFMPVPSNYPVIRLNLQIQSRLRFAGMTVRAPMIQGLIRSGAYPQSLVIVFSRLHVFLVAQARKMADPHVMMRLGLPSDEFGVMQRTPSCR